MQAHCFPSALGIFLMLSASLLPSNPVRLAHCPLPILGIVVVSCCGHSSIPDHRHIAPRMGGPGGFEGSVRGLAQRRLAELAELGEDWASIGVRRRKISNFPSLRQSVGGQPNVCVSSMRILMWKRRTKRSRQVASVCSLSPPSRMQTVPPRRPCPTAASAAPATPTPPAPP